jgi:hypothetical protein
VTGAPVGTTVQPACGRWIQPVLKPPLTVRPPKQATNEKTADWLFVGSAFRSIKAAVALVKRRDKKEKEKSKERLCSDQALTSPLKSARQGLSPDPSPDQRCGCSPCDNHGKYFRLRSEDLNVLAHCKLFEIDVRVANIRYHASLASSGL